MIKRIGILTFHASHNYGSMLQAYALQTYLLRKGYEVIIVNYRSISQKSLYRNPLTLFTRKNRKRFFASPVLFGEDVQKWFKFERFLDSYLHLSREHTKLVQTERQINDELGLDAIIIGGDQIWNLNCIDASISYYLPFETPGIRRISFAPSMGCLQIWKPDGYKAMLHALLSGFDFLSVREKQASGFISSLLGKTVPQVADPTILLSLSDYRGLIGDSPLVKGKYVFYYSPHPDSRISQFALSFAQSNHIGIVSSNITPEERKGFIHKNASGPLEFLNLLYHAEIVCGCSLHLAIFSILMHKPFFIVGESLDERMKSWLDLFGLCSHYVLCRDGLDHVQYEVTDWQIVDTVILEERQRAEQYLKTALG